MRNAYFVQINHDKCLTKKLPPLFLPFLNKQVTILNTEILHGNVNRKTVGELSEVINSVFVRYRNITVKWYP